MASSTNENSPMMDSIGSIYSDNPGRGVKRHGKESVTGQSQHLIVQDPLTMSKNATIAVSDGSSKSVVIGSMTPRHRSSKPRRARGVQNFVNNFIGVFDASQTVDDVETEVVDQEDGYTSSGTSSNKDGNEDEDDKKNKIGKSEKKKPQSSHSKHHNNLGKGQRLQHALPRYQDHDSISPTVPYLQDYQLTNETIAMEDSSTVFDGKLKGTVRTHVRRVPDDTGDEKKKKSWAKGNKESSIYFVDYLVMFVNILFPVLLMVLAALQIARVGKSEYDPFAWAVAEANTFAITVWQIMFAAICAQSLRTYATFRAERGIKLITLEQLLHSSSFHTALKQPLLFGTLDWTGTGLLLLWLLSPLGSQALQRMAFTLTNVNGEWNQMQYAMTGGDFSANALNAGNDVARVSLFSTAILMGYGTGQSPQDLWNYPKVPSLVSLSDPDSDGWFTVSSTAFDSNGTDYSSLMGIPFSLTDGNSYNAASYQNVSFSAILGYLSFECSTPETLPAEQFQFNSSSFYASPSLTLWLRLQNNDATNTSGTMELASLKMSSNVTGVGGDIIGVDANTMFEYSKCNFGNAIVTANVSCIAGTGACWVPAMQQYNGTNRTSYEVQWDVPAIQSFLRAVPDATIGSPTLQELYLTNPATIISEQVADFTNLTSKIFTNRVQTLVNTFYQVSGGGSAFTEGLKADQKDNIFPVEGYYVDNFQVLAISVSWTAIFFLCNTIILLIAIVDVVCRVAKVSPDFLGFASSAMESEYLPEYVRGRKISGQQKAGKMRGKVMLQDMKPSDDEGEVALAPKREDSYQLRRDRTYHWR